MKGTGSHGLNLQAQTINYICFRKHKFETYHVDSIRSPAIKVTAKL